MQYKLKSLLFLLLVLPLASQAGGSEAFYLDDPEFGVVQTAVPSAEQFANSYKVLGRGLENRKTGASLQLACVGEESSCGEIQFLLTDEGGSQKLLGAKMTFDVSDKLTRKEILRELREQGLAAPKKLTHTYQASRVFYRGEGVNGAPAIWLMFGSGAGIGLAETVFGAAAATFGLPMVAGAVVFLAIPLITDLVRLPFQVRAARRQFGYLFGEMGPNVTVKALEDRSKLSWQLKPKSVAAKAFDRFVEAIEKSSRVCRKRNVDGPCRN